MREKAPKDSRAAFVGAILSGALLAGFSPGIQTATLSPDHARWLEEEVAYVIAPREREVFEKLATREERERFIDVFWRRRDPDPATPENEFRVEHYRRRDHANHFFGRASGRDGFRTDRGRIYIVLGEPIEVRRFDAQDDIVPAELWFYRGEPGTGLPAHFYLLFFQKRYVGEYDLYSPAADGPDALVRGATALAADTRRSLERLRLASMELAQASLSFDPAEPVDFANPRPSIATGLLVDRIEDLPFRTVRTDYADAWLAHGDRISAEYSFNFVPSRGAVAVVPGPEGASFVHYGIELAPEDFTLQADESGSRYYTTLDVTLEVTGEEGKLVEATDKAIFMELTPAQMEAISRYPIAYQDDFPLLPGRYRTSVVLRNRASKQYTVLEQDT
ncbi:MAG: GWxTD domain-containing protein, partial [Vicinamibacteria bacterium]